ncbi:hypothetical protein B0H16DRAFT_182541 [Mycena metata]|uniref:Uncharacterized protein n=1 Tax=Mycena metata TaxID=1033252 RepID=A0AAD7MV56_9AGAR|nr:hypothetical protein B0H16DRAFT_182541 [Mycena metata]
MQPPAALSRRAASFASAHEALACSTRARSINVTRTNAFFSPKDLKGFPDGRSCGGTRLFHTFPGFASLLKRGSDTGKFMTAPRGVGMYAVSSCWRTFLLVSRCRLLGVSLQNRKQSERLISNTPFSGIRIPSARDASCRCGTLWSPSPQWTHVELDGIGVRFPPTA